MGYVRVFEQAIAEMAPGTPTPSREPNSIQASSPKPLSKVRRSTIPFIRGPIPLKWLNMASALSSSAARLSVAIWYRLGITGQHLDLTDPARSQLVVRIDRQLRDECNLERWHVSEGVRDLSGAGLIRRLKAGRGRCPVVEILVHRADG